MGVFHVFKIVQILPNRAKRPIWEKNISWMHQIRGVLQETISYNNLTLFVMGKVPILPPPPSYFIML